jgi:hypothetical protein
MSGYVVCDAQGEGHDAMAVELPICLLERDVDWPEQPGMIRHGAPSWICPRHRGPMPGARIRPASLRCASAHERDKTMSRSAAIIASRIDRRPLVSVVSFRQQLSGFRYAVRNDTARVNKRGVD